ncbi:hypothetical protein DEJ01_07670 [Curtobacterium sp. MCLR17_040]|uniref:type II toxin-antitoxin system toxin DNA ADP-ribosyl transferase DarT n=1 Tax=Curtobacterium sp. MCLR17_040 TaxID=2175625 RepID=UPI000DA7A150|nr:DUF4433 domain-containing protein [Curtobacterium sp. MCLR17_040]PZF04677.1 hypothetical protein DEJ01_07670 [Curtobacterium sp. MCLR17_040]
MFTKVQLIAKEWVSVAERKIPTLALHFTHVDNLETIAGAELLPDTSAQSTGALRVEVGNTSIKERRRAQIVPLDPGGSVADYVPFYFGPRSPMMYAIASGNVPSYTSGTAELVYIVTTLEQLYFCGCKPILTDRNAALAYAEYREYRPDDLIGDGFIDWALMSAKYWTDFPDGRERRMAECLVASHVPWAAVQGLAVQNERIEKRVVDILARVGSDVPVKIRPTWYF